MSRHVVVVIDDLDDIGPLEQYMVQLAAAEDVGFHVVSVGADRKLVAPEAVPRRLRLMLLMARLADRLIPVTGEVVSDRYLGPVAAAIARSTPDEVIVAGVPRRFDRVLRRDLLTRLQRLFEVDVRALPAAA